MIDRRQALKLVLATPALSRLALGRAPQADPFTARVSSAMQGLSPTASLHARLDSFSNGGDCFLKIPLAMPIWQLKKPSEQTRSSMCAPSANQSLQLV